MLDLVGRFYLTPTLLYIIPTLTSVYVNHRPAFGLSATKLYEAFEVLGLDEYEGAPAIDRGELLDILQTKGMQR